MLDGATYSGTVFVKQFTKSYLKHWIHYWKCSKYDYMTSINNFLKY